MFDISTYVLYQHNPAFIHWIKHSILHRDHKPDGLEPIKLERKKKRKEWIAFYFILF